MNIKQKVMQSIVSIIIAVFLYFSPGLKLPIVDSQADSYFQKTMIKAGATYATCRILNAGISLIKDSSLNLEPGGVGISLAVGQVLDPLDDMIERLADILVIAITSLGVQKLTYEIAVYFGPPLIAIFLLISSILIWFKNEKIIFFNKFIMKFLLIIIIFRFFLPVSSILNNYVYKNYFAIKISDARDNLTLVSEEIEKLKKFTLPEKDGVFGIIKNSLSLVKQKAVEFKKALTATFSKLETIINNLLKLTFLFVGLFLFQVLLLPLLTFWLLVKIVNSLFQTKFPVILHQQKSIINTQKTKT